MHSRRHTARRHICGTEGEVRCKYAAPNQREWHTPDARFVSHASPINKKIPTRGYVAIDRLQIDGRHERAAFTLRFCACRFNLIATTHTETTGSVAMQSDEPIRAQNALPETVWRTEGGAWLVKGKCSQRLAVNASLFHGVSATGGHSLTHTQRNLIRNDRPQDSSVAKVQDKDRPYRRQATALPTQHVRLILSASVPACRVLPPRFSGI